MKKLFFAFFLVLLATSISSASVSIDATSFPDSVFRQYISNNFDLNKDGTLSDSEIDAVEKIDVLSHRLNTGKKSKVIFLDRITSFDKNLKIFFQLFNRFGNTW